MTTGAAQPERAIDPTSFAVFRFLSRSIDDSGRVELRYALDDDLQFTEVLELPVAAPLDDARRESVEPLLALLHWVAGVSYYKVAAPPSLEFAGGAPPPAAAALLRALYRDGLGEFAYTAGLQAPCEPSFAVGGAPGAARSWPAAPERVLVPVGGGKDSAVAIEIVRRAAQEPVLFSVGSAPAIERTVRAAGLPWLVATRALDASLAELNAHGAYNGHVPVTAIVACTALLTASLRGLDAVALANERSASHGSLRWHGVEINHQFSKGREAEVLLRAAAAEAGAPEPFSVLRQASELAVARAFSRLGVYHGAFTSCNAIFRRDPSLRASSWCCSCPKCRFVFLALAPFSEPEDLAGIFGRDLLADGDQTEAFALLTATGGHKPFECVGEEQESIAALRLLAADPRWRDHVVVRELTHEVLAAVPGDAGDPAAVLALAGEHDVPAQIAAAAREVLGA
ncbi:MAG TPA: hypothetical protein VMA83_05825 [Solirubrobacteraceae bacterium]|nr:hypothetical protein [Solirubrobacteraceae bacterium]